MTTTSPISWGIISTANIAKKNVLSIAGARNAVLRGVASRDIHKAISWIKENVVDLLGFGIRIKYSV